MVRLEHRQNWNGRRPYTAVLTVMSVNVSRCGQAEYKSSQPIMTPRELGHRLFLVVLIVMLGLGLAGAQTLAIHGDQFAVNGQSKFLIFVSYFDAMRRAGVDGQGLVTDFAFLGSTNPALPGKVDGIRILPNWWAQPGSRPSTDSLIDSGGNIRDQGTWDRFVAVLSKAKMYNLLVNVTFTIETIQNPPSFANYQSGIQKVVSRLEGEHPGVYRNVMFDVQNEFNNHLPEANLDEKYAKVKVLVTAVTTAHEAAVATGSVTNNPRPPTPTEAGAYAVTYQLPVVAFHERRTSDSWFQEGTLRAVIADIKSGLGAVVKPIALDEPQSWTADPSPGHCTQAVKWAQKYGAALWTFHTQTNHDLARHTMLAKMTNAEKDEINGLRAAANLKIEGSARR